MTVLGIDTSTILGGVALVADGRLLGEVRCDARAAASERILPQVERLLADLGVRAAAIERIGVSLGPGSFTGVRVGLATAKGLAIGWERPVVGIASLAARIHALGAGGHPVLLASAPRRGEVFCAAGWFDPQGFRPLLSEASRPLAEAGDWVAEALRAAEDLGRLPLLGAGDGLAELEAALAAAGRVPRAGAWLALPGAVAGAAPASVALLAAQAPAGDCLSGEGLDRLLPLYLRGSEARRPGSGGRGAPASGAESEPPARTRETL